MKWSAMLCGSLVIAVTSGCGPSLTQPSQVNITGRWAARDSIGPLIHVQMDITQKPDGTVTGQWTGDVSPPNPVCPPGLGSSALGPVSGTNTVLEVHLSLLGAGEFEGQAIDATTLKG